MFGGGWVGGGQPISVLSFDQAEQNPYRGKNEHTCVICKTILLYQRT